jgi:hypothetical protein
MDRTVAHLNIEHYRKLLTREMDETTRQTILRLLAEEEAKLASLTNLPDKKPALRGCLPTPSSASVAHQSASWSPLSPIRTERGDTGKQPHEDRLGR